MSDVTLPELQALCDFAAHERLVRETLTQSLSAPRTRVRFLARYAHWNGYFGSGVAAMAGKIGRSRGLLRDAGQPVHALADRSVYVASFFFDAARDEFDDRDTVHRDTHRCLAQSLLAGVAQCESAREPELARPEVLNELTAEPDWLHRLCLNVAQGYGVGTPDDLASVFRGIGYHLGSELLADREFSIIDETLRHQAPDLVEQLRQTRIHIAGQEHVAYQWIAIHSGHGGGAEADHFEWASQGARLAFRFSDPGLHDAMRERLHEGFRAFADDHRLFFENVTA